MADAAIGRGRGNAELARSAARGLDAYEFDEQIKALQPLLSEGWQVRSSKKTGNPLYVRPSCWFSIARTTASCSIRSFPNRVKTPATTIW